MKIETTCGNCKNLIVKGLDSKIPEMVCEPTGYTVPCDFDGKVFTLNRIPLSCHRPSSEVLASAKLNVKQNRNTFIIIFRGIKIYLMNV